MLFTRTDHASDADIKEKFLIEELITFERYCRDYKLWTEMKKCFHKSSTVNISWYHGSGYGFIEASEKMKSPAPHKMNSILIWINGRKAIAECLASILIRKDIGGVLYDLTSYVRLHYKLIKDHEKWMIYSLECVYEKDSFTPVFPNKNDTVSFDEFIKYRPSYACLSYLMQIEGYAVDQTLPGEDLPDTVNTLYDKSRKWLDHDS